MSSEVSEDKDRDDTTDCSDGFVNLISAVALSSNDALDTLLFRAS